MCFSATSSFAAAGMLTGIGMLALLRVKRPITYPRAVIPFGFALQQAAEGVVWITYGKADYGLVTHAASLLFLIFAMIVWPVWIPFCLTIAERSRAQFYKLLILTLCGMALAAYAAYLLYLFPVHVAVMCHSIAYTYGNMTFVSACIYAAAYVGVVVLPFFISTLRGSRIFGILLSLALLVAWWAWYTTAGSVWCFFAALLSSLIVIQVYVSE